MTKLEKAKEIIKEHLEDATCGIFDSRNLVGDWMTNIYNNNGLAIDICYNYSYFEVFGLSKDDYRHIISKWFKENGIECEEWNG